MNMKTKMLYQTNFLKNAVNGIIVLCILLLLSGCGGGGGRYYPPKIAVNTIGLQKIELAETEITNYDSAFSPINISTSTVDRVAWRAQHDKGRELFGDSNPVFEVAYCGEAYYLHASGYGIEIVRKNDMKEIQYLRVPRYVFAVTGFQLNLNGEEYLAVYIEQQSTSHSSTFFIVNKNFEIVYQEHLLGAEEIGYTFSEKYGNCIILKSENFWYPNGLEKPIVRLNGDWVYCIPPQK